MPSLALVVVTHNSAAWLAPLAESWTLAVHPGSHSDVPTVIADSGSQDDTLQLAARCFPAATVVPLLNGGFGSAANAAIRQTTADWILLCNPDLTFPATFGAQLHGALSAVPQDVACIAPRLLHPDGSPQPSIGRFPTLGGIVGDQFRPPETA